MSFHPASTRTSHHESSPPAGPDCASLLFCGSLRLRSSLWNWFQTLERAVSGSDFANGRDPKGVVIVSVQIGAGTRGGGWTTRARAIDIKGTPDVGSTPVTIIDGGGTETGMASSAPTISTSSSVSGATASPDQRPLDRKQTPKPPSTTRRGGLSFAWRCHGFGRRGAAPAPPSHSPRGLIA